MNSVKDSKKSLIITLRLPTEGSPRPKVQRSEKQQNLARTTSAESVNAGKRAKIAGNTTEVWSLINSLDKTIENKKTETAEIQSKLELAAIQAEQAKKRREEQEKRKRLEADANFQLQLQQLATDRDLARKQRVDALASMKPLDLRKMHRDMNAFEKNVYQSPLRKRKREMIEFYTKTFPPTRSALEKFPLLPQKKFSLDDS